MTAKIGEMASSSVFKAPRVKSLCLIIRVSGLSFLPVQRLPLRSAALRYRSSTEDPLLEPPNIKIDKKLERVL